MTVLLPQDGVALAREIFDAIDARDLTRTGALLDDGFLLHNHGVPDSISNRIVEWCAAEDDLGLLRQIGAVIA